MTKEIKVDDLKMQCLARVMQGESLDGQVISDFGG